MNLNSRCPSPGLSHLGASRSFWQKVGVREGFSLLLSEGLIPQAFGQSFLQPDIHLFKQNLFYLETLNSKQKLYHKVSTHLESALP